MNPNTIPVQTGPVYRCFQCGKEGATFIAAFTPCGTALDPWSPYIWYLKLLCNCKGASRVIRLDDCIAPLAVSDPDGLTPADIPAIQAALQVLARVMPPDKHQHDPAARIVYDLLAGAVSPHDAIAELHALADDPTRQPAKRMPELSPRSVQPNEAEAIFLLTEGAEQGAKP